MRRLSTWAMAATVLAVGCSDPKKEPAVPPQPTGAGAGASGSIAAPHAASGVDTMDETSPLGVDEKVRKLCDLPESHFGYNSSSLNGGTAAMLDKLATCFVSGAGKDKGLYIVGHADPRGETEYNFALGQRRAASVVAYLSGKGMSEKHLESSSKGELEATGTDDAGWAKDRKVQIFLAE